MKESTARKHLEQMALAIHRCRSIIKESDDKYAGADQKVRILLNDMEEDMHPYLFGKKCPLAVLLKVLDSDHVQPATYSNMMYIALALDEIIGVIAGIYSAWDTKSKITFPMKWDLNMVLPWESE